MARWTQTFVLSLLAVGVHGTPERPNFLILFADDMGYGDMSCNGHPTISTPNLDQLASEGTRFTQWYSGFHVCSPSRASMLTGRLPIRSGTAGPSWTGGVFQSTAKGGLPTNETTFASLVRDAGYATLAVGKWHVGQQPQFLPTSHGFDEYFGIPYSVDMGNSAWAAQGYSQLQVPLPLLHNTTVVEQPVNLNTLEKRYVQKVSDFISANAEAQKPFLVYLAWSHVHTPDFAAPEFCNSSLRGRFGDAMEELDSHIGEVMSALRRSGAGDNTLVFFTSDNGPWLIQRLSAGSQGTFFEGKTTTWEGGIRVPAIAWWPGRIPARSVSREVAATYDIFTTVVLLAGAKVPQDRIIDGRDLSGVLFQGEKGQHRCLFHYKGTPSLGLPPREEDPRPGLWAVRCGAYKAHFVTSCAVMQLWGDTRCGESAGLLAPRSAFKAFEECKMKSSPDECALMLGSGPTVRDPPLLYNVEHDPSEMYPLDSSSSEYQLAMEEIREAKLEHEATLVQVPNQISLGKDDRLRVCCSEDTTPACTCNPENFHPSQGVCSPVYPPTSSDGLLSRVSETVV